MDDHDGFCISLGLAEWIFNCQQVSTINLIHALGAKHNTLGTAVDSVQITALSVLVCTENKTARYLEVH